MNCDAENLRRNAIEPRRTPAPPPSRPSPRWNGTAASTGSTTSSGPSPNRCGEHHARERDLPWVHRTALGSPLVPEVKISMNRSSGSASAKRDRRAAVGGEFGCPVRRFDVDDGRPVAGRRPTRRIGEHDLAVGVRDVARPAPRRAGSGSARPARCPPAPRRPARCEKNGVFPAARRHAAAGRDRAGPAARRPASAPCSMWSRQLTNESSIVHTRGRSTSTSGASRSATVTVRELTSRSPDQAGVSASSRPMRSSCPVAPPTANSVCLAARK